ncbi:MAG: hypothetical protein ABIV47_18755 [Roseiflexaceae bacterium]
MFSPDRRALRRLVRTRLGLLAIVSIAVVLATIGSPNPSPAWLQPVQYAFAQSDTATPTIIPQPDTPPNPTVGLGEPPLTLHSSASVASAGAGEQFSFTTTIAADSVESRAVELRANIDGQLELLSTSGGSCSGGSALSCKLSVQRGQPATIVATVRVRSSAAPGSRLVYQALAQDDLSNTAASDQVAVAIATAPAAPTTPPAPAPSPTREQSIPANDGNTPAQPTILPTSRPARPQPTAPPATANAAAQSASAPAALTLPTVPAAIMHSSAGAATVSTPANGIAPADSWLELAPDLAAQSQALDPGAPAMPKQEVLIPALSDPPASAPIVPVAVEQRKIIQLPNTATAPPISGLAALLLGLAMTIHGLRRVRCAAAQLDRQGAALGRLTALLTIAARRARIGDQPFESREE